MEALFRLHPLHFLNSLKPSTGGGQFQHATEALRGQVQYLYPDLPDFTTLGLTPEKIWWCLLPYCCTWSSVPWSCYLLVLIGLLLAFSWSLVECWRSKWSFDSLNESHDGPTAVTVTSLRSWWIKVYNLADYSVQWLLACGRVVYSSLTVMTKCLALKREGLFWLWCHLCFELWIENEFKKVCWFLFWNPAVSHQVQLQIWSLIWC